MIIKNFIYDNISLKDKGYILCNFDNKGLTTVNGNALVFNTVSIFNNEKFELINSSFNDRLEGDLYICKNICKGDMEEYITHDEYLKICTWLCRRQFHELLLIDDKDKKWYFNASFNVSTMEYNNKIVGLNLHFVTDASYAMLEKQVINHNNVLKFIVDSKCTIEGYIYPKVTLILKNSGDLKITNSLEDGEKRFLYIKACKSGDVITFDEPIITISTNRNINDDFNWNFLRLNTNFNKTQNIYTLSQPCDVKFEYNPIVNINI